MSYPARIRQRIVASTLLASGGLLAALASHAALQTLQNGGLLGSSYDDHAHGSVGVVAALATLLLLCAGTAYAVRLLGDGLHSPVVAMAQRFGASRSASPYAAVALTALAALGFMELAERLVSGESGSFASAYGSVPIVGAAIVVAIACGVTLLLRRFARWLGNATRDILRLLVPRFIRRSSGRATAHLRRRANLLAKTVSFDPASTGPDRAPPLFPA